MEDICLYDFIANYEWYGEIDNGDRKYSKLTKPRLSNHKLFDPEKENEREDYYYSFLLLFVPFRDEGSLLLSNETAEEAFNRLLPTNVDCSGYHDKLQKMLKAQSNIKKINEARQADGIEEKVNKVDDDPQLLGEAKTAMKEVVEINANNSDTLTLEDRITMLNDDQRRIFDKMKYHLLHQKQHEDNEGQCEFKTLQMFVSGVGGTGKSFLIQTIKPLVNNIWPSNDLTCALAAPTGLAAFNVGGITIHRLFQLPSEHDSKTAGYWSLPKTSHKVMKTSLRNVKIIIIDEVSMVSSLNLAYIHLRLDELFGGNDWFGSRNMIFVGDLLQLQQVNGNPVFERITNKTLSYKLGCAVSVNIWRDSVIYDELTVNERQKKGSEFSSVWDSVRCGFPTDETISILNKRVITMCLPEAFNDLQESGQSPVLPYTPGLSENIDVVCKHLPVRIAFTSKGTLGNMLTQVKTPIPPLEKTGVIYAIHCECGGTYIGETGRTFKIRMREHKRAMKIGDHNNAISVHVHSTGHSILWDKCEVLAVEENWRRRKIREAILIKSTSDTINTDPGVHINPSWDSILPSQT